jgi:predicted Zn-dependent protease
VTAAFLFLFSNHPGVAQGQQQVIMSGDPSQMQAYQLMQQGMNKLQAKDARGARQLLEQAASQWPDMPHIHYYLGFCYNDLGEYAQAIPEFEKAIQADPQRIDCMINIATCYQLSGKPADAADWFERYLKQKPNSPKASQIRSMIPALRNQASKRGASPASEADYFSSIQINRKPRRWSRQRMPIRFFIANGTNDKLQPVGGFKPDYNFILADAINSWVKATGGKIAVSFVPDANQADVVCSWTDDPNFHCGGGQVEQGTALWQESELPDGSVDINRAFITILVNARNTGLPLDNTQMARACMHEVGHALGLAGHSMNGSDIMFYSEVPTGQAQLSERDVRTINRLYQ